MTTAEKLKKDLAESKPTLVEFYATWCGHCQAMAPVVDELRRFIGDRANILQIDGDADPELRDAYHIDAYPTWILFKDGQEAWRDMGRKPESELEEMIRKFV